MIPSVSSGQQSASPQPAFGLAPPLAVTVMRNDVLSRGVIDIFGETPTTLAFSRNCYDFGEKALDLALWIGATLVAPVWLDNALSNRADAKIRQQFSQYLAKRPATEKLTGKGIHRLAKRLDQLGRHSILQLPWGWLRGSDHGQGLPHTPLGNVLGSASGSSSKLTKLAKDIGFHSTESLKQLLNNTSAKNKILAAKLGILVADLAMMGGANLLGAWGKNWLTKTLSGKAGFSGEFNYAHDDYLTQQTQHYETHKGRRFLQSLGLVAGITAAIPALVVAGIHSKGKTLGGKLLKRFANSLNYHQGVFTSKWLMLWGGFLSWLGVYTLAARDKHERREELIHAAVLVPTYIVGDDVVGGLGSKALQSNANLAKHGVDFVKKGVAGLPAARPLWEVLADVGQNTAHPVYKAARANSWFGLLGATVLTVAAIPLINHPTTRQLALKEQTAQSQNTSLSSRQRLLNLLKTPLPRLPQGSGDQVFASLSGNSPAVRHPDPPLVTPNFNRVHQGKAVGASELAFALQRFQGDV